MDLIARFTRLYGSQSSYEVDGAPWYPFDDPIHLHRYPARDAECYVEFGRVPPWFADAYREEQVHGTMLLHALSGSAEFRGKDPSEVIAALRERPESTFASEDKWNVCVWIDRRIEVDDRIVEDFNGGLWLSNSNRRRLIQPIREETVSAIDQLVWIVLSKMRRTFPFTERRLERVFFLTADGKQIAGQEFAITATMTAREGPEMFPASILPDRLQRLATVPANHRVRLNTPTYWFIAALEEQDPWKRFTWAFLSLETLANKAWHSCQQRLRERCFVKSSDLTTEALIGAVAPALLANPNPEDALSTRFAIIAIELSGAGAGPDVSRFNELKDARNAMAHGRTRKTEDMSRHAQQAVELASKYFRLVADELLQ